MKNKIKPKVRCPNCEEDVTYYFERGIKEGRTQRDKKFEKLSEDYHNAVQLAGKQDEIIRGFQKGRTQSDEKNSSRQSPTDFGTLEKIKKNLIEINGISNWLIGYTGCFTGHDNLKDEVNRLNKFIKELLSQLEDDEVKDGK